MSRAPYLVVLLGSVGVAATGCDGPSPEGVPRDEPAASSAPLATVPKVPPAQPNTWDGDRWTDGEVLFVVDRNGTWPKTNDCSNANTTMAQATIDALYQAHDQLEALTPVRFIEKTVADPPAASRRYILYRNGAGSSAEIRGMPLDNSPNCVYLQPAGSAVESRRLALHETVHALGNAHEQQRKDRNQYIVYDSSCITNDPTGKLFGRNANSVSLTPYDTTSVMQYASTNSCDTTVAGCDYMGTGVCAKPPLLKVGGCDTKVGPPASGDRCWIDKPIQLSVHDVNGLMRMYEEPLGENNPDDELGSAFAVGDFDADGYSDLAVGAPGNNAVFLWKGTAGSKPGTLGRPVAWKVLRGSDVFTLGQFSKGAFGIALAAGDFDDDGKTDLAVGASQPDSGDLDDGSVIIYSSRPATPDTPRRTLAFTGFISQAFFGLGPGDADDRFGAELAAGDFDFDGKDDLAIGAPRKVVNGVASGAVYVKLGKSFTPVVLTPDLVPNGRLVEGGRFGAALVAGHLGVDRVIDLVVGSNENAAILTTGRVYLYFGSLGGLVAKQTLVPSEGVRGRTLEFGTALAIGDFLGNGTRQLAVGAPARSYIGRTKIGLAEAGGVYLFELVGQRLTERAPVLTEDTPTAGNRFGQVLTSYVGFCAGFDCAGEGDLLIAGMPDALSEAGKVVRFSFTSIDPVAADQTDVPTPGSVAAGDRFGAALARGNFLPAAAQAYGRDELVVGRPGVDEGAGAFHLRNFDGTDSSTRWKRYSQVTASPE